MKKRNVNYLDEGQGDAQAALDKHIMAYKNLVGICGGRKVATEYLGWLITHLGANECLAWPDLNRLTTVLEAALGLVYLLPHD
jgi:hypothetical protein